MAFQPKECDIHKTAYIQYKARNSSRDLVITIDPWQTAGTVTEVSHSILIKYS